MRKLVYITYFIIFVLFSMIYSNTHKNIPVYEFSESIETIHSKAETSEKSNLQENIYNYIPFIENSIYEFQSCFFENFTYLKSQYILQNVNKYNQNIKTIKVVAQNSDVNGNFKYYATFLYVYNHLGVYRCDLDFKDKGIYDDKVDIFDIEKYLINPIIDEKYENSTQDNPMRYYPIIKMPLEVGTNWEIPFNQNNHYGQVIQKEITGIDIPIETLLGKLHDLEITGKIPKSSGYYEKHYYIKDIGLIMSKYGAYDSESNKIVDNPYSIDYLTTLYNFNREYDGKFYKDLHVFEENIQVKTFTLIK